VPNATGFRRYEHTQRSIPILLVLCLGAAGTLLTLQFRDARALPLGLRLTVAAGALAMVGSGVVFSSLTIMVDDGWLGWHFGLGLSRKTVPLADVVSAEATTTTWMEGRGIRYTARGWLYNVAGRQAVLVAMRDGKRFMLGTDEPDALVQAIRGPEVS
jgi:hypothetical protein